MHVPPLLFFFVLMVFVNCCGILLPRSLEQGQDDHVYFHIYNAITGMLEYRVKMKQDLYNSQGNQLSNNNPRHIVVNGILKDVPIMRDFLGIVNEARQIIEGLDFMIFPGDIPLPSCLVDIVQPSIAPLTLSPGSQEGYYTIYMDPNRNTDFEYVQNRGGTFC